jgi:hypothetical protein
VLSAVTRGRRRPAARPRGIEEDAMKTDKQKAQEILEKRKRAEEGLRDESDMTPEEREKARQEKVGDVGIELDLGLKR